MKNAFAGSATAKKIILTLGLSFGFSSTVSASIYEIDTDHTSVGFTVAHMKFAKVNGRFDKFAGKFEFDEKKKEVKGIEINIDAASINTNSTKRDEHLKSPDFFDATQFPQITFKGEKVNFKGDKPVSVTGTLKIRDVVKPATFTIDYQGIQADPWKNHKMIFSLKGKVNRKDFGIVWQKALETGGLLVGEEVTIEVNAQAMAAKKS